MINIFQIVIKILICLKYSKNSFSKKIYIVYIYIFKNHIDVVVRIYFNIVLLTYINIFKKFKFDFKNIFIKNVLYKYLN